MVIVSIRGTELPYEWLIGIGYCRIRRIVLYEYT